MIRSLRSTTFTTAALVALAFSLLPAPSVQAQATVLAPHSTVAGKTIGEWTGNWWQWAFSLGATNNPFTDSSQAAADNGQSGAVYFLAGTTGGAASRTFNVPGDKYLLLPLLNNECSDLEGNGTTDAELRQGANDNVVLFDSLHATLDGVTIPSGDLFLYRESTPGTFSFDAVSDNVFGVPAGHANLSVADGYYLMLAPLGSGTHDLNFGGGVSAWDFSVDVSAHVTAVPEPGAYALLASLGVVGASLLRRRKKQSHQDTSAY